ncbi:major strawberry allergen Fra a 1-2-like [Rhododendron vialii]|uniref:major strawberry allergen Fra a 1-2-like n=1 Tax=Rhododendron vialii TaxID=182163 RepID=UPI00265E38D7|nr:major strawberry allergen Fra a 1-2-like [Rhododendron vialii]
MGVITYDMEVPCSIPPARVFKASVLDADTLIPKIMPQAMKSVETLEGDGGAGTIKLITLGEGYAYKTLKHRVDAIDKENFTYSSSVIDGAELMDKFESISYHTKIVPGPNGGSIYKIRSIYETKGDAQVTEEEIKSGKEAASVLFKALEAYLLANPDA